MATPVITLGENLSRIRYERRLSQDQLCAEAWIRGISISRATVSHWERGHSMPTLRYLNVLTEILRCSLSDLLGVEVSDI